MTNRNLIEKLEELKKNPPGDTEIIHMAADNLLLDYINDKEVSKIFVSLDKWYA